MRIISGKYKNQKIKHPKISSTRPMMDFVKETLFNVLHNKCDLNDCLLGVDLFAGSGQLGLEALSRGAQKFYFNDINYQIKSLLKDNLCFLNNKMYQIFSWDYLFFLKKIFKSKEKINLLIIDPPFKKISFYYKIFDFVVEHSEIMAIDFNYFICESEVVLNFTSYPLLQIIWNKKIKNKYLYILIINLNEKVLKQE